MRTIRAFLAIRPSDDVLTEIAKVTTELSETGAEVRWVRPEGLHVTIKFLGEVPEGEIAGIDRALEERFAEVGPVEVDAKGIGVFPNWKRPRVVWVGLAGDGLATLADVTERALAPLGFPPEGREFEPHLTIGRLRGMRGWEALSRALQASRDRSFGIWHVTGATLYKSVLRPEGSIYTPLRDFSFGSAASV